MFRRNQHLNPCLLCRLCGRTPARYILVLVNPRDFRSVPGRFADVKDAECLVDLLAMARCASFVPGRAHRELRELVRYRKTLVEERAREFNRIEKVLEGANVKLGVVASRLTGKSAREMLHALLRVKPTPCAWQI